MASMAPAAACAPTSRVVGSARGPMGHRAALMMKIRPAYRAAAAPAAAAGSPCVRSFRATAAANTGTSRLHMGSSSLSGAPSSKPAFGRSHGAASAATSAAGSVAAAAMPLGLIAEASEVIFKATGVPLVDELMRQPTMQAALVRSAQLLALLAAAALVGSLLLRQLRHVAGKRMHVGRKHFQVGATLLAAALRPCQVMLPLFCATRAATVIAALVQVAATKHDGSLLSLLVEGPHSPVFSALQWVVLAAGGERGSANAAAPMAFAALQWVTQIIQDCSELVLVTTAALTALDFKNRFIAWQTARLQSDSDPYNDGVIPLLRLASIALNIVIVWAAVAVTLTNFGFHIGPLMASIGGVGVIVGFASQDLLANIASAVSLFLTRPFVSGDQVQFLTLEGVEVEGTIINIEPTRCVLLEKEGGSIIHINNGDVAQMIIKNESQAHALKRLQELEEASGVKLRSLPELALAMRASMNSSSEGGDTSSDDESMPVVGALEALPGAGGLTTQQDIALRRLRGGGGQEGSAGRGGGWAAA